MINGCLKIFLILRGIERYEIPKGKVYDRKATLSRSIGYLLEKAEKFCTDNLQNKKRTAPMDVLLAISDEIDVRTLE